MIERWFTRTGEIHRKTQVSDGAGGFTDTWIAIMTSRGCLDLQAGTERVVGLKVATEATHIWVCSPFTVLIDDDAATTYFGSPFAPSPITNKDRMVIDGKAYDIVYVDDPMGLGKHLEIYLKESDYV